MKLSFIAVCIAGLNFTTAAQAINARGDKTPLQSDRVTVATGFPYLASLEYSIDVLSSFRGGLVLAKIPGGEGIGLRLEQTFLSTGKNPHIRLTVPVFYYPTNSIAFCGKPWLFAWPSIDMVWRTSGGTSWSLGAGLASASCLHTLLGHHGSNDEENQSMSGTWYTIRSGWSMPVMEGSTLTVDASAVMSGLAFADWDQWVARIPVMLVIGLTVPLD